jgi:hypothetical protein
LTFSACGENCYNPQQACKLFFQLLTPCTLGHDEPDHSKPILHLFDANTLQAKTASAHQQKINAEKIKIPKKSSIKSKCLSLNTRLLLF